MDWSYALTALGTLIALSTGALLARGNERHAWLRNLRLEHYAAVLLEIEDLIEGRCTYPEFHETMRTMSNRSSLISSIAVSFALTDYLNVLQQAYERNQPFNLSTFEDERVKTMTAMRASLRTDASWYPALYSLKRRVSKRQSHLRD